MAAKAFDREKLLREIASDDRARRRAAIVALRAELRQKRSRRTDAMAAAAAQCRAARDRARAAREAAREAASRARGASSSARSACAPADYSALTSAVVAARERLREEEEAAREIRAIDLAEAARRRGSKKRASSSRERRSESDDEVRSNIPPEFVGLFERVKKHIKGNDRKSRTEAFLEYVEEHPGEVYEGIDDETDRMIAEHEQRLRASNPGKATMLIELGKLTAISFRDQASGRRRVLKWGLRTAPILAYDERGKLFVIYGATPAGRASSAAVSEYARTHWGKSGAGARVSGHVALDPLETLGEGLDITYTTRKGGDELGGSDPVDYVHAWGEGARGEWKPPTVRSHVCRVPKCAIRDMISLTGGTYRVTPRGIVG